MRERIGSFAELAAQTCTVVEIDGRSIAVWFSNGAFYALRNSCPHMGADLSGGTLGGTMLPSKAKEYCYGMEGLVLRCPWHGYEFSLETGEPVFGSGTQRVVTYPVTVDGQDVYVEVKSGSGSEPEGINHIREGVRS